MIHQDNNDDSRNVSQGLGLGYGTDFIVAEDCINDMADSIDQ